MDPYYGNSKVFNPEYKGFVSYPIILIREGLWVLEGSGALMIRTGPGVYYTPQGPSNQIPEFLIPNTELSYRILIELKAAAPKPI